MLTACDCDMFETMQVQPLVDEIFFKNPLKKKKGSVSSVCQSVRIPGNFFSRGIFGNMLCIHP